MLVPFLFPLSSPSLPFLNLPFPPFLPVGLLGAFPVWAETPILHHPLQHPDQPLLQLSLLYSVPPPTHSHSLLHSRCFTPRTPSTSHASLLSRPPLTLTHTHSLSNLLLLSLTPSSISLSSATILPSEPTLVFTLCLPQPFIVWSFPSLSLCPPFLPTLAFFHPPSLQFYLVQTPLSSILRGSSHCSNSHPRHLLHPLSLRTTQHTTHYPSFPGGSWLECEDGFLRRRNRTLGNPHPTYSNGSVGSWTGLPDRLPFTFSG